jgi:hypothetical protein
MTQDDQPGQMIEVVGGEGLSQVDRDVVRIAPVDLLGLYVVYPEKQLAKKVCHLLSQRGHLDRGGARAETGCFFDVIGASVGHLVFLYVLAFLGF